jgi:hypothetical protein
MSTKLIEVELPFTGFYESVHDDQINGALECTDDQGEVPDDFWDKVFDADVDWTGIQNEYAKQYTDIIADVLGIPLVYKDLTSPREYNFSTDRIFADARAQDVRRLRNRVAKDPGWADFIHEQLEARSGFIPFYSNDILDPEWTAKDWDACQYELLIRYILENQMNENLNEFVVEGFYESSCIGEALEKIDNLREASK